LQDNGSVRAETRGLSEQQAGSEGAGRLSKTTLPPVGTYPAGLFPLLQDAARAFSWAGCVATMYHKPFSRVQFIFLIDPRFRPAGGKRLFGVLTGPHYCRHCSTYMIKVFAWGDSGGHLLQETTSRGLCGLVCPSRTSERWGERDCVTEGGQEGERERERALGLLLCHSPRQ
jgi:hypothetical protein